MDSRTKNTDLELRVLMEPFQLETRGEGAAKQNVIVGYASVFGKRSVALGDWAGEFYEEIAPGALDGRLTDDVICCFNHNESQLLGRNSKEAGTLRLSLDAKGLRYECDLPDTSAGRDVMEYIRRKEVTGSSFRFKVKRDSWRQITEGDKTFDLRTITQIERLADVAPVTFPAYPDSEVQARSASREEFINQRSAKLQNYEAIKARLALEAIK